MTERQTRSDRFKEKSNYYMVWISTTAKAKLELNKEFGRLGTRGESQLSVG